MAEQNRILIISHDVVGQQMAGPGIRYYHLARVLSQEFDTVLAIPDTSGASLPSTAFEVVKYNLADWDSLEPHVKTAKVVIFPSDIASIFRQFQKITTPIVIDGYDPLLVEWLALHQSIEVNEQCIHWQHRTHSLSEQYLVGDFFICASERQRDWWIGLLEGHGRLNPYTFHEDHSLRKLIDLVPFGLAETAPQHTRQLIKGVWPGISSQDKVILWGGGLWPWLDPLTAVRAMAKVWSQRQDVRLIFPGTRHPNPMLKNIQSHNEAAVTLAQEFNLLDKAIFFGDWIPYPDWPNVLLESDLALTLHYDSLETRLAFRSRVFDYIWASLPTVATQGDATSDLLAQFKFTRLVKAEDSAGVANAILELLDVPKQDLKSHFMAAHQKLTWQQAARPLIEFCRAPRQAPDKVALGNNLGNAFYMTEIAKTITEKHRKTGEMAHLVQKINELLSQRQQLVTERKYWQNLVKRYEQGRFMRLMRWLNRMRVKLLSSK